MVHAITFNGQDPTERKMIEDLAAVLDAYDFGYDVVVSTSPSNKPGDKNIEIRATKGDSSTQRIKEEIVPLLEAENIMYDEYEAEVPGSTGSVDAIIGIRATEIKQRGVAAVKGRVLRNTSKDGPLDPVVDAARRTAIDLTGFSGDKKKLLLYALARELGVDVKIPGINPADKKFIDGQTSERSR